MLVSAQERTEKINENKSENVCELQDVCSYAKCKFQFTKMNSVYVKIRNEIETII